MVEKNKENQKIILEYLNQSVKNGRRFFKSKHIAKELNLTPKTVGANLTMLSKTYKKLQITQWSYSLGTTWMIEKA